MKIGVKFLIATDKTKNLQLVNENCKKYLTNVLSLK